jgi:hypothetical protein
MPDRRQLELLDRLSARGSVHAGLYATAVQQLEGPATPGRESARISVICHCIRELMLGALDMLVDTPEPRPNPTSGSLASELPTIMAGEGNPDLRADQDLVPVPRRVAAAFADLIDTSARERGRNQRNAAALVTGSANGDHPSIREWSKTYQFFVKWAHVDQHHAENLPDDATLVARLRVVEDVIDVRMNLFFDNLAAVEDLLALANGTDEVDE